MPKKNNSIWSWKRYKYKNLTLLGLSFFIALFFLFNETFHSFLLHLNGLGYLGVFIAGLLFVSTFTVTTGIVILLVLAETLPILWIGVVAGLGAVLGDLIIFRFIRNQGIIAEMKLFFKMLGGNKLSKLLHTKYFGWTLPVIGALIIVSPLPDELGVSLMGISKMNPLKFVVISFVLNTVGIVLVLLASIVVKP